jgi:hypothetical protein
VLLGDGSATFISLLGIREITFLFTLGIGRTHEKGRSILSTRSPGPLREVYPPPA